MENNQTIGAKILALRKARGVTQADLGVYLNISYQAVSKWERDESCPDFETLSRVAQFFGVPITYFEKGGETAVTVAVPTAESGRVMLGVCKECGKVVYEGDEAVSTPLTCKKCHTEIMERKARLERQKVEAAKKEAERQQKEREYKAAARREAIIRSRNRGLIWGGIVAGLLLVLTIVSAIKDKDFGLIVGAFIFALFAFTFVSQLFWDGAVFDCTLAGGHIIGTPGIIFTFDLDGFIFLIAMKILFAILRMFVWILTVVVCALAAIIISPFTFVPALFRVNKGDLVD